MAFIWAVRILTLFSIISIANTYFFFGSSNQVTTSQPISTSLNNQTRIEEAYLIEAVSISEKYTEQSIATSGPEINVGTDATPVDYNSSSIESPSLSLESSLLPSQVDGDIENNSSQTPRDEKEQSKEDLELTEERSNDNTFIPTITESSKNDCQSQSNVIESGYRIIKNKDGNNSSSNPEIIQGAVHILSNTSKKNTNSLPRNLIAITFVNGIYHSEEEWKEIADDISDIFGTEVYPFYYPSTGNWVFDAREASITRFLRPAEHPQVKRLVKHLRFVLATLDNKGRVLHLAHSGGAILTYLAAKHHLTVEERNRIDVITFGGGRSITRKYFGGYIVNYYASNDLVSLIDGRAAGLKNKHIIRNETWIEIRDEKHNTTFIFLRALANNVLRDHSMTGPTYRLALRREAAELRKRIDIILRMDAKDKDRIRKLRKYIANITGIHHFWQAPVKSVQTKFNISDMSVYMKTFNASVIKAEPYIKTISSVAVNSTVAFRIYTRVARKVCAEKTGLHNFWAISSSKAAMLFTRYTNVLRAAKSTA